MRTALKRRRTPLAFWIDNHMIMDRKKHCIFCGALLIDKHVEGRKRLFCPPCNRPIYENPVPATCVVVVDARNQVLLVERNIPPKVGQWCLPGGFIELGESPEAGALREMTEETGLAGKIDALIGVVTTPSAQWFEYPQLPIIAFGSHRRFMQCYFQPDDHQMDLSLAGDRNSLP